MLKFLVRPSRSVGIKLFAGAVVCLALFHLHLSFSDPSSLSTSTWRWNPAKSSWGSSNSSNTHFEEGCEGLTGFDRIVITIKTGATEASNKIPTLLKTSLRCAPNVMVFSDMAQKIGSMQVYDSLDTISKEITTANTDFDIYRKQYELGDPKKIMKELSDMRDPRMKEDLAAWTLDKYKNMHIVEKAWALKPEMDWYLHIDADTYVVWSSLIHWIQRLDASKKSYMGSLALINDLPFGHGGSGYLMSREAMRDFAVEHNGTAAKWDDKMHEECCGDWVLAQALKEFKMDLKNAWPTINGETAATVPFGDDHWCQPLVTMHHISTTEADQLAAFEAMRLNRSHPILYSELFYSLVRDLISPTPLPAWNNHADDETLSLSSAAACTAACAANSKCLQSRFNGVDCKLGTKVVSYGEKSKEKKDERVWESSWNKTRIAEWAKGREKCGTLKYPWEEKEGSWMVRE